MPTETVQFTGNSDKQNATPEEGIEEEAILLETPHSRMLGGTEYSWCKALGGGTGITILAMHFSEYVDPSDLQQVVHTVQMNHPRLRSQLVWIHGKPAFSVSPNPYVEVQVMDSVTTSEILCGILSLDKSSPPYNESYSSGGNSAESDDCNSYTDLQEESLKDWQHLVEYELNINPWSDHSTSQAPKNMLAARLYCLPLGNSLAVLRLHTSICDRASAATILKQMLHVFYERKHGHPPPNMGFKSQTESNSCADKTMNYMAIEDAIPKGKANKPFWTHGVDLLGYSLGSRRHSNLPFEDPHAPRHSQIVRLCLSSDETTQLLKTCKMKRTTMSGAITAAGLKATAVSKQLGNHSEHYCVITLIDCRGLLDDKLFDHTIGFYHSAILNTHQANEVMEFWEVARRCSSALENSMKNRKHFIDMGDVNFLMRQAIQHPSLTPSSSLRTSLIVVFEGPMVDEMRELKNAIGLEDYMGCSSVHGVGPSLAVFDTIRNGALDCACVYPAPLHSRKQMQGLINTMKSILTSAIQH
eukprot:Gb_40809 [translate_table: standard]